MSLSSPVTKPTAFITSNFSGILRDAGFFLFMLHQFSNFTN